MTETFERHNNIVGRGLEIEALENALRGAALGVAHVALVTGESGVGKSALLAALAAVANAAGADVLRASGEEFEAGLNFGIVDQLLEAVGEHVGAEQVDRFSVGGELIARWRSQADAPLYLVLVDDAQWADAPSLQALTFAFRRLSTERLMAVVACRSDAVSELPPGLVRLARGSTGSTIELGGLDRDAFSELMQQAGIGRLTPAQLERIREHTEGNPMHALALARELGHDQLVSDVTGPLQAPRSIVALVLAHIATLSPPAEGLVVAASVLGPGCTLAAAARLAGLDNAAEALAEAEREDILVRDAAAGGIVIRFAHATTRSAVYHDVGADRISELHRRAASLVTDARDVLRHRLLGTQSSDEALAMKADATAEALARSGAWVEAATWLGAAERVSSTDASRSRRALTAEMYRLYAGSSPRLLPGTDLDAAGDHPLRPLLLGMAAIGEGRFAEAEAFLLSAWESSQADADHETHVRVASRMVEAMHGQLRPADGLDWASRAVALVPEGRDVLGEDPLSSLAYALIVNGHLEEARHLASGVGETVGASSPSPGLFGRSLVRLCSDDLVGAVADLRACAESSMRLGPPRVAVEAIRLLAEATFRLGEWDLAERRADDALGLARELGIGQVTVRALATATLVPSARGRWHVADALLDEARQLLGPQSSYHSRASASIAAARLSIVRGQHQSAVDALATVASVAGDVAQIDQQVLVPWRLPYGLALTAVGRLDDAGDQAARLARYAADQRIGSIAADAARLRGGVAAARGEVEPAIADLRDAAAVLDGVPMPFEAATVNLELASSLKRAGRNREALEKLEAARSVFARLQAAPLLDRCDREIAETGHGVDAVVAALSPAEAVVARLVADGRSNREVAAQLVISVRTVEHHLRSVYAKLGLASRTQLAALLKSN